MHRFHQVLGLFILVSIKKSNCGATRAYGDTIGNRNYGYNHDHHHQHRHDDSFKTANITEPGRRLSNYNPEVDYRVDSSNIQLSPRQNVDNEEHDPDYPYNEIRNYVQNNPILKQYFVSLPATIQIGNRAGVPSSAEDEGSSLCKIKQYKLLYPKRLKNVHDDWKTVVNIKNEYEQGIETKTCFSNGKCPNTESLAFGYTSYCAQEYITKELMVYNSTTAFDLFRFPSCCVCKIKQV